MSWHDVMWDQNSSHENDKSWQIYFMWDLDDVTNHHLVMWRDVSWAGMMSCGTRFLVMKMTNRDKNILSKSVISMTRILVPCDIMQCQDTSSNDKLWHHINPTWHHFFLFCHFHDQKSGPTWHHARSWHIMTHHKMMIYDIISIPRKTLKLPFGRAELARLLSRKDRWCLHETSRCDDLWHHQ